jgi:hypothetical protein
VSPDVGPAAVIAVAVGISGALGLALAFGIEALIRGRFMARRERAYRDELAVAEARLADPDRREPVIMPRRWDIVG